LTPAARLHATLDLLSEIDGTARPADAVTSGWFRTRRHLDDKDRGAIIDMLYMLLRHHGRLGWWLDRLGWDTTPRNRVLAWLTLAERRTPEQIGLLFAPAGLTYAETSLLARLRGHDMTHPAMPDAVRLECPPWALAPLQRRFAEGLATEMAAMLVPPPTDLRVNTIKATRDAVLRDLKRLGLPVAAMRLAPSGIRINDRVALTRIPGLKSGEVEIQDEGSQLVALLVDARAGERVVDFCAGAGGKTLAMAAQMNNRGRIIACDVNEARLKRCAERLRGAGIHNAETRLLSSETDRWVKRHKGSFDRVLIDAPCSGTGTWRRNPDARWRAPVESGLESLVALQSRILARAARLVRPGGRLVYATCSLLAEENEDQVTAFLASHPDFVVVPLGEVAPQITDSAHPDHLLLTPARHGTDGFFAAVLRRNDPTD